MSGLIRVVMFMIVCTGCSKPNPVPQDPAKLGSRPPIPDQPDFPDDSLYVLADPDNPGASYYRRLALIQFESSATDADATSFFPRFSAEIVGGVPVTGTYYVRFPDAGPSWAELDSVLQLMNQAPGVRVATEIARVFPKTKLDNADVSGGQPSTRMGGDSASGEGRPR